MKLRTRFKAVPLSQVPREGLRPVEQFRARASGRQCRRFYNAGAKEVSSERLRVDERVK